MALCREYGIKLEVHTIEKGWANALFALESPDSSRSYIMIADTVAHLHP